MIGLLISRVLQNTNVYDWKSVRWNACVI